VFFVILFAFTQQFIVGSRPESDVSGPVPRILVFLDLPDTQCKAKFESDDEKAPAFFTPL
jgi:hypothetical protein